VIAGPPEVSVVVPQVVREAAAGRAVSAVWENMLGGLTFRIGEDGDHGRDDRGPGLRYVKWAPAGSGIDLAGEAARLRWAAAYTPVPEVLDVGCDAAGSRLVTAGLPGENAVTDRWKREPATAVAAIGAGLRAFHEALPVAACPYDWSVGGRLADIGHRASAGRIDPRDWHDDHRALTGVDQALDVLADAPPIDRLVVCHGDTCAPNTLLTDDGRWSGHVDLGSLGVADRWADLAIATWSTRWNYGPGWEEPLLDAYGIDPDPERTRYYRLLSDLGP
jgi:kanamycin kinase